MVEVNSPFRYPGGKFYARKLILEHITPHTYYAEPFAGGASIFFAKEKALNNLLNDMDEDLINVYKIIRDNVEDLITLLDGIEAKKENHSYYKSEYKPTNALERALRWYYLNRVSYSGIMNMQNCYWGYGEKYSMQPKNWPRQLRRCSEKLQGIELTCLDFEEAIQQIPDNAFLFIDPPYFNADQDKFYACSFDKEKHYRLAKVLSEHTHRFNFLLTYDNSPEVRDLYGWSNQILDREWNYTISRTDDQTKKTTVKGKRSMGKEIFIMNYNVPITEPLPLQLNFLQIEEVVGNTLNSI